MSTILAWLRLLLILLIMLVQTFISLLYRFVSADKFAYVVKAWASCMLLVCGVKLTIHGKHSRNYIQHNTMIVSNHISWLDIIVLYKLHLVSFVGKAEMLRWPILNMIIKSGGTIFIDRTKKRDLLQVNETITKNLVDGRCIGLFPEGTTSSGHTLLPFKAPILEAAISAKSKIIPVVLMYYRKDGKFAYDITYANRNLWQTVMSTLRLNGLTARAVVLESIDAGEFKSREELSAYLYQKINEIYTDREAQKI